MIIAEIKGWHEKVYLHGIIRLSERELLVNLLNENGISLFTKIIKVPVDYSIHETIFAEPGFWKLSYKSKEGAGEIGLHL